MAPDRGSGSTGDGPQYQSIPPENDIHKTADDPNLSDNEDNTAIEEADAQDETRQLLADRAAEGQNFTLRGVLVGLAIGVIICFSNMYFGLQTGWVSGMAMPAALIGFAFFKSIAKHINYPFTPVENVLVQTVAGAVGTMPLGCGFVGVLPALNYLLKPEENGPLVLGTGKLIIWALGICLFGVFIAVPLRKEVIIREKLKFPSGTATALMIGVLHGNTEGVEKQDPMETIRARSRDMLRPSRSLDRQEEPSLEEEADKRSDWKGRIRLLIIAFAVSAVYTLASYFIPPLHDIPIFGLPLARNWLWTFNPSPAYIGQGIIMGPATTLHMLLGATVGWGILSPLAKTQGWAPHAVGKWEGGSKGWIVWVSLAIMLADSVVNLGWLIFRPVIFHGPQFIADLRSRFGNGDYGALTPFAPSKAGYTPLASTSTAPAAQTAHPSNPKLTASDPSPEPDAPPSHLVSPLLVWGGLLLSLILCTAATHIVFASLIPLPLTILSLLLALLLSLMGVRALGETDLNPVSGISKLTQLVFALLVPSSNPNAIIINLIAGAISESGALQAGDMMQDLKTGHLLGAAPKAQFWGQIIGSVVGAVVSAGVYRLYTSVYTIPGGLFGVPTAFVWIFTARLVTGKGLPAMAGQWALGAGCLFAITTAIRIVGTGTSWQAFVPGGIAVAVGMYNEPSFTLARTCGGVLSLWWARRGGDEGTLVVVASGLILGEGVVSIVNLGLASLEVPHL
ncbi:hypothetical protein MMC30_003941 [Trapelia coarctata]|nr:hypothetical protein [Trapelia coarctata]